MSPSFSQNVTPVVVAIIFLSMYYYCKITFHVPNPINDITTNIDAPLKFIETNPPYYDNRYNEHFAPLQQKYYPDLGPRVYPKTVRLTPNAVFQAAVRAAKKESTNPANRINFRVSDPLTHKVQGSDNTVIGAIESNWVMEVIDTPDNVVVHMRSKTIIGLPWGDQGINVARINLLFEGLDRELREAGKMP